MAVDPCCAEQARTGRQHDHDCEFALLGGTELQRWTLRFYDHSSGFREIAATDGPHLAHGAVIEVVPVLEDGGQCARDALDLKRAIEALREIQQIAAREWAADETNYEFYGDIAGIAEGVLNR